jgi:phage N-6-adenine-methyltransferase
MSVLPYHPLANIFPLLGGAEFGALVTDIRAHGLRESIKLLDGSVLDGRNRLIACKLAGVEPRFEEFTGNDPLAYVLSLNLTRRHLDASQRAMVHARIATLPHGVRSDTAIAVSAITQEQAAALLNISIDSGQRARRVIDDGIPELAEKVECGQVSVSAAAEVARLPEPEQQEIVDAGSQAVVEAARDIRTNGMAHRTNFTGNNQWFTPQQYIDLARQVLGEIDLDPASHPKAQECVRAAKFFTHEDDGLKHEWRGRVWMNPPYSQPEIGKFITKLIAEFGCGKVSECILLTNNCSDTAWFHAAIGASRRICFTRGRISFLSPAGESGAPVQGQTFFYLGPNAERFENVFSAVGAVVEPKTGGAS